MAKTTVQAVTVTLTGDPPALVLPATNTTEVQDVAVAIAGSSQTATVQPAG